jgi:RimJ/RimL family protein N-acetyltransferase
MNINGRIVTLRAIEERDLELLHKWANDPITQDGIGELHFPSSADFHKAWFQGLKNDSLKQRFAIDAPNGDMIGYSSIVGIDWRNRHAWHGLTIGEEDYRGKCYGVDAIMATMRYAFDELNLERLEGAMIEYNQSSVRLYCSRLLGWTVEGRKRRYFFRKGCYWDQILVGITRQDYLDLIVRSKYWGRPAKASTE